MPNNQMNRRLRIAFGCAVILLPCLPRVSAHEAIHKVIDDLTRQIASHPNDAALYIRRGDLWRDHRDWDAALVDFERAADHAPDHPRLEYLRARTFEEAGWHRSALIRIDRHLLRFADDGEAHLVRARALSGVKDYPQAARAYQKAIDLLVRPQPDHYLEYAEALRNAGGDYVGEAVQCLDKGIARLGPIVALQRRAIELEAQLDRYDQALARIDIVMGTMRRKETWLAFRGRILEQAGRLGEAREAYEASRVAIESLADRHRRLALTQALETEVRSAMARLDAEQNTGVSQPADSNMTKERE